MKAHYDYYAGYQVWAGTFCVDGFHALVPPDYASAQAKPEACCDALQEQRAYLPYPLDDDDVLVDRYSDHASVRSPKMWYLLPFAAASIGTAEATADAHSAAGSDRWRLPTQKEIDELRSIGDLDALRELGFQLSDSIDVVWTSDRVVVTEWEGLHPRQVTKQLAKSLITGETHRRDLEDGRAGYLVIAEMEPWSRASHALCLGWIRLSAGCSVGDTKASCTACSSNTSINWALADFTDRVH